MFAHSINVPIIILRSDKGSTCMLQCFIFQCAEKNQTSNVDKVERLNNQKNGAYATGPCELLVVYIYSHRRPAAFIFQQVRMDVFFLQFTIFKYYCKILQDRLIQTSKIIQYLTLISIIVL